MVHSSAVSVIILIQLSNTGPQYKPHTLEEEEKRVVLDRAQARTLGLQGRYSVTGLCPQPLLVFKAEYSAASYKLVEVTLSPLNRLI